VHANPFVTLFSQTLSLTCTVLVGILSLSSVCQDLHSSLFHGDKGCAHTCSKNSCGSDEGQGEEKDGKGSTCAVVLFGQGLDIQTHFEVSVFTGICPNAEFFSVHSFWTTCKHDPFGARGPPLPV
jgi:hypothetical protein